MAAAAALGAVTAAFVPVGEAAGAPPSIVVQDVKITARDGVQLTAHVARPATGGPYPLVVQPGTFAAESINTNYIGEDLATKGYVTVGYLERGLGSSGGQIDGGGPKDRADVSDVLTWALANTPADPARVGVAGLSYGGGIALQAAAFDPRIRVVVNIAGWVDLAAATFPHGTRADYTLQGIALVGGLAGRFSPEASAAINAGLTGTDISGALAWAEERSARAFLDRYAVNKPALFMAHSMNETLAPVDSTLRFFEAYPGPKHEDLRAGDHGSQEVLTPLGASGPTWVEAYRWLDAWLKGGDQSITNEPPVTVEPRSSDGKRPIEHYPDTLAPRTTRRYLTSQAGLWGTTTTLTDAQSGTGGAMLHEGQNWLLHVPIPMLSRTGEVYTGRPLSVSLALIDRGVTGVWEGPRATTTTSLRGPLSAHLVVTPSAATGTVTVYSLDVDELGTAYMIAQAPVTFRGATPGKPLGVDVDLPYNAYDVAAGHHVAIAVSTGDPMYRNENPSGSTMAIGAGSYVDLPLR